MPSDAVGAAGVLAGELQGAPEDGVLAEADLGSPIGAGGGAGGGAGAAGQNASRNTAWHN